MTNNDNGSGNAGLDKYQGLWDEYKYRHDLIWQRTFTFTTAITLISTIPYLRPGIGRALGNHILIAPALACLVAGFGLLVMNNELNLFTKIRRAYRERQNYYLGQQLHDLDQQPWWCRLLGFRAFVTAYFAALVVLGVVNFCIVWRIWLPFLLKNPSACL